MDDNEIQREYEKAKEKFLPVAEQICEIADQLRDSPETVDATLLDGFETNVGLVRGHLGDIHHYHRQLRNPRSG